MKATYTHVPRESNSRSDTTKCETRNTWPQFTTTPILIRKKMNSFNNTTICHATSHSSHKLHKYAMHNNIKFNYKTHAYTNVA